jgi:hypothetical protein
VGGVVRNRGTKPTWGAWHVAVFLCLVGVYYTFVVSAGHFTFWPHYSDYFDQQAEGFRLGHLHTAVQPNPRLLKAGYALDPVNRAWWVWDQSYYNGHFYLYWGLAPAALLALAKAVLQIQRTVHDPVLVYVFALGRALFGYLVLIELAERSARRPPRWAVWLAAFVFATANPIPYALARPEVYEAALMGGACFTCGALYAVLRWLGSERTVRNWPSLAFASLLFGLAGTCRPSLLPAGALSLALVFLVGIQRALRQQLDVANGPLRGVSIVRQRARRIALLLLPLALPFTVVVGAQLTANYLRFGSWSEFGARYQMGLPAAMSARYVIPNIWSYLLHPIHKSCEFPFLYAKYHSTPREHLLSWMVTPVPYYEEPLAGILSAVPFTWLLVVAACWKILAALSRWFLARPRPALRAGDSLGWFGRILAITVVVSAVPALCMCGYTMRYEVEVVSSVVVASVLTAWWLLGRSTRRLFRWPTQAAYVALAACSILFGAAYGFSGYYGQFALYNPALLKTLKGAFDACSVAAPTD